MAATERERKSDFADAGKFEIYADTPEVGLVSLTYEASLNEWNLDDVSGFGRSLVVPESVFRRTVETWLKGGA